VRVSFARNQHQLIVYIHTYTPPRFPLTYSCSYQKSHPHTHIMSLPKNAHVSTHPCLQAKLSQLRSASTGPRDAQTLVHEIALMIGYEALGAGLTAQQDGTVCSFLSLICCNPGIPPPPPSIWHGGASYTTQHPHLIAISEHPPHLSSILT
jgi:hypothetical protein